MDLEGQLAGGHEHQPAGLAGLGVVEPFEHGEAEGERLAGAGLGLAAHVAAGQRVRDGEALDGERLHDALVSQDLHEAGGDAEVFEGEEVALGGRLDVGVVHDVADKATGGVSAAPHHVQPGRAPWTALTRASSSGVTIGPNRVTWPPGATRNFSKFHWMSPSRPSASATAVSSS